MGHLKLQLSKIDFEIGECIDFSADLGQFAGNSVQILIEAEDNSNTIVEAAVNSVLVETVG